MSGLTSVTNVFGEENADGTAGTEGGFCVQDTDCEGNLVCAALLVPLELVPEDKQAQFEDSGIPGQKICVKRSVIPTKCDKPTDLGERTMAFINAESVEYVKVNKKSVAKSIGKIPLYAPLITGAVNGTNNCMFVETTKPNMEFILYVILPAGGGVLIILIIIATVIYLRRRNSKV